MLTVSRLTLTAVGLLIGCGRADPPPKAVAGAVGDSAVVLLDSAQQASAALKIGPVGALPPDTVKLTGTLSFDPARISHVGPRIQGRIRQVRVDVGSPVQRGDTLALLDSPELGTAQATWTKAVVSREIAGRNLERAARLARDGVVSERRRLELEAELREREAELAAAVQALAAIGADPDSSAPGVFPLRAPLGGEVVEQHATVGEVVGPESDLFAVGDLSRLWLLLDLFESDLSRVRVGTPVQVVVDAVPGRIIDGRIGYVGALVDTASRTIKVRVEILNSTRGLKPGMFARASLVLPAGSGRIGVPLTALQSLNGRDVVFVKDGPGRFRPRTVKLGPDRAGGWREILEGLSLGDTVVMQGSFVLKAHSLRATFGDED
jgi:cobalt-zinc-cadmium efflux system membrane fusion protein